MAPFALCAMFYDHCQLSAGNCLNHFFHNFTTSQLLNFFCSNPLTFWPSFFPTSEFRLWSVCRSTSSGPEWVEGSLSKAEFNLSQSSVLSVPLTFILYPLSFQIQIHYCSVLSSTCPIGFFLQNTPSSRILFLFTYAMLVAMRTLPSFPSICSLNLPNNSDFSN